jgi:DNA polymerase-1
MSLLIVDGFSLAFRAFYAYPLSLTLDDGQPINAVFGFMTLLLQAIDKLQPSHIVVCFDRAEPTFRHTLYDAYKANRSPAPDEFKSQVPLFKEAVKTAGIFVLEKPGYEADDLMGKCALLAQDKNLQAYIYSSDQDTFQLVTDSINIVMSKKGQADLQVYNRDDVHKKMGVYPEQVIDFKALKGDSSDNIPGVKGIGDKTASTLLLEHQTLEGIYSNIDTIKSKSVRSKLQNDKESAFLSQSLATICTDIDISQTVSDFEINIHWENLKTLFLTYKFTNLLKKYDRFFSSQMQLSDISHEPESPPQRSFTAHCIQTESELEDLLPKLVNGFAFDVETTSLTIHDALLVGVSICFNNTDAYYIPLIKHAQKSESSLNTPLFTLDSPQKQTILAPPKLLALLQPLLESPDIQKVTHNGKYDYQILKRYGITMKGMTFDTMLAAFLVKPLESVGLKALTKRYFNVEMTAFESLTSESQSFQTVSLEDATQYASADAFYTRQLKLHFEPMIKRLSLSELFQTIECPLQSILADMEFEGVAVDLDRIHALSQELTQEQASLMKSIYDLSNKTFNINSTKQLSEILFDDLKLPVIKKTKTGRSTDNSVLEALLGKHAIIDFLIQYRTNEKLLSTYINAFPHLIHPTTGKIHTTFNQHSVITGRLSSTTPNLQNIPIRTEKGQAIRSVFVPSQPDHCLMSVDYSQIELRLMAHFSEDQAMITAFNNGEDIHRSTAAVMFHCDVNDVTSDQRYRAKAVNFGIIYGISSFGLSKNINCSVSEAKEIIDNYFLQFPNIQKFIDKMIADARANESITTAFGRVRPLPNIHSQNRSQRQFEERAAVNTFLQGTAAEILKKAMIVIDQLIVTQNLNAKMIIQVHDELVFDVHNTDVEALKVMVSQTMQSVVNYHIPLTVDMHVGNNWQLK